MSDTEKKMNILIEEANANYNTQRYKDAARTFEHLISLAIQNDEPEEAIYFAYRAADSWKKGKNPQNRAQTFAKMGSLAFNFGAQIAEQFAIKTKNIEEKAKSLFIAGECLSYLQPEKAKVQFEQSVEFFQKLAVKEKDTTKKVQHLRNALEAIRILKNKKKEKALKIRIANLHIKIAETNVAKENPENMQIALRSYEDALELFNEIKSKEDIQIITKKIEQLKQNAAEYDPFAT
ncbi:MAG: hypothetical protein KAS63_08250 [Candidatus Heimdallarchaeota archaeon]|nr:hypothetical protein [Candidatus Heimdallarchaeota archaeon]MCK4955340.1 hypothetical protein [Candidatus Heimdallarchaeota archaeon]